MTSVALGTDIFQIEVTTISRHGIWILLRDEELFLAFDDFPWFPEAPVGKVLNVALPFANHLYWPELDLDLSLESIRHPERFPLVSQAR